MSIDEGVLTPKGEAIKLAVAGGADEYSFSLGWNAAIENGCAKEQPVETTFDKWCESVKDCGHMVQPNSATARQRKLGWDAAIESMSKRESGELRLYREYYKASLEWELMRNAIDHGEEFSKETYYRVTDEYQKAAQAIADKEQGMAGFR